MTKIVNDCMKRYQSNVKRLLEERTELFKMLQQERKKATQLENEIMLLRKEIMLLRIERENQILAKKRKEEIDCFLEDTFSLND